MSDASREIHEWDAAYVLGGLDPRERSTYEQHLESCARCAASVAELAGLPGILAALPADEAAALVDEGAVDGSSPALTTAPVAAPASTTASWAGPTRPRRTGRVLVALAAGVVVVGAAGYALGGATGREAPTALPATAAAMTSASGSSVSADLAVTARSWGTRFDWTCRYDGATAPTGVYDLVAVSDDGTRTVVATWRAVDGTAGGLVAASSLATDSLAAVEIVTAGSSAVLASAGV